jgi:hypothetical protein
MRNWIIILLAVLLAVPVGMAQSIRDDDDKDPSIRPGIRRLHPERERAKAIKKLQEQMSRKADTIADPWDTSDDVWGTVDLPPVVKDGDAVEGHRLSSSMGDQQEGRRLMWRDEPVTVSLEQLMPFMVLDNGEYRSKYVTGDSVGNEVFFAFDLEEDSLPGPLRLCVRYSGDRPMDYDQVVFTINGYDYFFYPSEPRHGVTADHVFWTASDDVLRPAYRDLVYALAHGQWAMLKMQGPGGVNRIKVLTSGQLDDFSNTLALYRLLGGDF